MSSGTDVGPAATQRCFWRTHTGLVVDAEVLSGQQSGCAAGARQQELLIRLVDTGERRLVRLRDTWPCRTAGRLSTLCQKCRQRVDPSLSDSSLICQECRNVFHKSCGLLDPGLADGYPTGFFRCRNCCFRLAVRPLGAVPDGRDGRLLRAAKRQLEYSPAQLTWPNDLENSDNVYCYCGGPGNTAYGMLRCIACKQHFHLACVQDLPDWMRHGLLPWDRFYAFLCACCNKFEPQPGTEFVHRLPLRWPDLVHMCLLNLAASSEGSGFHWARHVTPWLRSVWHRLYVSNLRMAELETQVTQSLSGHAKRFQPVVMTTGDTLYRPICPLRPPVVTPPQPGSHLARVNWAARISYAPPRGDLPAALLRDPALPGPEEADAIGAATAAAVPIKKPPIAAAAAYSGSNNVRNNSSHHSSTKFRVSDSASESDSEAPVDTADVAAASSKSLIAASPRSPSLPTGRGRVANRQQRRRGRRPLLNLPRRRSQLAPPQRPLQAPSPAPSSAASESTAASSKMRGAKRGAEIDTDGEDDDEPAQPARKRQRRVRRPAGDKPRQRLVDDSDDGGLVGGMSSDSEDEQSYHSADFNTSEDDSSDADFVVRSVGRQQQRRGRGRPPGGRLEQRQQRQRRQLVSSDSADYIEDDENDVVREAKLDDAVPAAAAAATAPSEFGCDDERVATQPKQPPPPSRPPRPPPTASSSSSSRRTSAGPGRPRGSSSAAAPSIQTTSSTASLASLASPPARSVADSAAAVLAFVPPAQRHPFRLPWELPVHTDARARRSLWLQVHAVLPPPPPPPPPSSSSGLEIPAKLSELEAKLDVACRSRQGSPRKLGIGQLMGTRERRLLDGKTTVDSLFRWW